VFRSTFLEPLGIKLSHCAIIGSAGKKDPSKNGAEEGSSGDIDYAVQVDNRLDFLDKAKARATKLGLTFTHMPGLGIISLAFPIVSSDGTQDGDNVQIDVMPVPNIEFVRWSYFSPSYDVSQYKGLYRNEVLFAVARHLTQEVTKEIDGEPVEWNRYFYDLNQGLMYGTQSRLGKRNRPVRTVSTIAKQLISSDPDVLIVTLMGKSYQAEDVMTWEQAWDILNTEDFHLKDRKSLILRTVHRGLQKKGVAIPDVLRSAVAV
jgi:hypothetical protein